MCTICSEFNPFAPGCSYEGLGTSGSGTLTAPSSAPVGTPEELADYLVNGYWTDNGQNPHAFDTSASNVITVNLTGLDDRGKTLARAAMEAWEAVANIDFVETSSSAQITFSDDKAGAYSSYSTINNVIQTSTVNVSTAWVDYYGAGLDSYAMTTYIHELGHALGLGHQGNYNGSAIYGADETFANDSFQLSIMSYFAQTENPLVDASYAFPNTPMLVDILAIQQIYGAPTANSATAGATIYGVGQTVGNYFGDYLEVMTSGQDPNGLTIGGATTFTIYDASGTDTVDFRTDTTDQYIDLRGGGIWDVYGLTGNVIVSLETVLENYVAGSGDDWILANNADNSITAGSGDDAVRGLGGDDALNGGKGADLLLGGIGDDTLNGGDGNDVINGQADRDLINGGDGDDTLRGLFHEDTINGGNGDDMINGGSRDDVLSGNAGSDTVLGDEGNDLIYGNQGNDVLRGGNGKDTLNGGSADDMLTGGMHSDVLNGDSGHDTLAGEDGYDTLNGGLGNDKLIGGANHDDFVFDASFGRDTIADFEDDMDELYLDSSIWGGGLSAQGLIDTYASTVNGSTVLNFGGGNLIVLAGVADAQSLVDDIVIF